MADLDWVDPGPWLGAGLPRGYSNVTDQVDLRGLDLLNSDSERGPARVLFGERKPASLDMKPKGPFDSGEGEKDWFVLLEAIFPVLVLSTSRPTILEARAFFDPKSLETCQIAQKPSRTSNANSEICTG